MIAVRALARTGRVLASVALWLLMVLGAGSLALWALNTAGVVQPLIVVSGSMEPGIRTGDLLVSTAADVSDLAVGDVATLRSADTGDLVTHRIVDISNVEGGVLIRMQGDANNAIDAEHYFVADGDRVWQPRLTLEGAGFFVASLMRPAVAVPLVIGILLLCSLSLVPSSRTDDEDDEAVPDAVGTDAREEVPA